MITLFINSWAMGIVLRTVNLIIVSVNNNYYSLFKILIKFNILLWNVSMHVRLLIH